MSGKLNDQECAALQEYGLLQLVENPNKRKISSSYLSPPTSSSGSTVSSSTSSVGRVVSASWASPPAHSTHLVYPASPVSVDALEFIGLNKDAAERVFASFQSMQIDKDEEEAAFPTFIEGHLRQLYTNALEDLSTVDAFTRVGLTADTIAAILDPKFQEVFETRSPFYWAWDTLRMRYNHVLLVEERVQKSAAKAVLAKKGKKRAKVEDLFGGEKAQASQSSGSQTHATTGTTRSGVNSSSPHLPTTCAYVESAPTPPENHLVLYTGKCPAEFGLAEYEHFVAEDGSINMDAIASRPGGDFNGKSFAWYFTTEYETADIYRGYAALRCPNEETWIIRIMIPMQSAATLRTKELWWSYDFREFVWHCRKVKDIPDRLQQYDSVDVLKGHMLKYPTLKRVAQNDIHNKIVEDKLCKLSSGRKATQWVAKNTDTANKLRLWGHGNLHIEVFAADIQQ
ncbi:hypothetical protein ACJQWK_00599 [Exserohilum turcicum]|uniref:Uncharacterized protein n=1 Tax=Exserohilum turcicum (strain 28A) TaxID=671987 RepID=R0K0B3_EXST2|nr:uncharacterized protein SETTUDRAFT_43022 [Exserohilum turcica Et28A]EOA83114.1 hypothetical protein SETTUDRAFT_43022 [Exserohilum turcica Et28A]